MSRIKPPTFRHEHEDLWEDLDLWGRAVYRCSCSCGWISRPMTDPAMWQGLFRRHIILAGRGREREL